MANQPKGTTARDPRDDRKPGTQKSTGGPTNPGGQSGGLTKSGEQKPR